MNVTVRGAPLVESQEAEIVLHIGFAKQIEDFPFRTKVPAK